MGTTNRVFDLPSATGKPVDYSTTTTEREAHHEVLERVLASETFRRSQRLREFLKYVADHTLAGDSDACSEQAIGERVFGRGVRFNPADDNIVRATARSLRAKLRDYSETEGREDAFRIEIPKGSYTPRFIRNQIAQAAIEPASQAYSQRAILLASLLVAVLVALVGWLTVQNQSLRTVAATRAPERTLLSALLGDHDRIDVVLSDALYCDLAIAQGHLSPLEDYESRRIFQPIHSPFPDRLSQNLWELIRRGNYANVAEAHVATRIAQTMGDRFQVRSMDARAVTMRSLQMGENVVLLGGRRANPWAELYEKELHFQMEFPSDVAEAVFRNKQPLPGERSLYQNEVDGRSTGRTYARIAVTPGLAGKGRVFLAAGNSGEATAAAGELLIQPRMLDAVESLLGKQVSPNMKRLELVIEREVVSGSTRDFKIVAAR
jgi:hypothetical protein